MVLRARRAPVATTVERRIKMAKSGGWKAYHDNGKQSYAFDWLSMLWLGLCEMHNGGMLE